MASTGRSQPSDSPPAISTAAISPAGIVCCMCGDPGLSEEIFRCKSCLFRSQHKYCSDFYPKAESYTNCNWCLRETRGKLVNSGELLPENSGSSSSSGDLLITGANFHRGISQPQFAVNKPVKKQSAPAELGAAPPPENEEKGKSKGALTGSGRVNRQTFRGKVRRYKLLEEVTCKLIK